VTKIIQVGLGFWGVDWSRTVLPKVPDIDVVGYVDPTEAARARVATELGVEPSRLFPSLEAALDATDATLVLGTVRTEAHDPVARMALEAGRNVMLEKPFASSMREARQLVDLAARKGKILAVSQNYRYFPAPVLAARLFAEQALGPCDYVRLEFRQHGPSVGYRYWDMPDPLLADMSIHHFDLMRMVLGSEPKRIACRTWNPPESPYRYDPAGSAMIEFESGVMLDYHGSWMSGGTRTPWAGEWTMDCRDGELWWTSRNTFADGARPDRVVVRRRGEKAEGQKLPNLAYRDRAGTLRAVCAAIETGKAPPHFSSGADNLMSFALVAAAIVSASRGGAWTDISEILESAAEPENAAA
jgi:predicted dehydrogenase